METFPAVSMLLKNLAVTSNSSQKEVADIVRKVLYIHGFMYGILLHGSHTPYDCTCNTCIAKAQEQV